MKFLERKSGRGCGSWALLATYANEADNVEQGLKKVKPFQACNATERQVDQDLYVISKRLKGLIDWKRCVGTGLSEIMEPRNRRCRFLVGGEDLGKDGHFQDRGGPQQGFAGIWTLHFPHVLSSWPLADHMLGNTLNLSRKFIGALLMVSRGLINRKPRAPPHAMLRFNKADYFCHKNAKYRPHSRTGLTTHFDSQR
jgi:hypothetical protein